MPVRCRRQTAKSSRTSFGSFAAILSVLFLMSLRVSAAPTEIKVVGQCTPYQFSYFSYKFSLNYQNSNLPEGSKIELQSGYAGAGSINSISPNEGQEFHWWNTQTAPAVELRSGQAQMIQEIYYMQTSGYLSDLEFRLKITLPDGSVRWDNGGSATSYYQAKFFQLETFECDKLIQASELGLTVVK